jgi:hypothetical protein
VLGTVTALPVVRRLESRPHSTAIA